jgi:3'(2'), 5'-bisphosphate nucleotidase
VDCGNYARQQQTFQVFEKGQDDYVTTVDQHLDRALLAGMQRLFPQDGIVTEENKATVAAFQRGDRTLWFVDPIDGTDDFIQGRKHYAVMVGQTAAGVPQAGWIYAPELQHLVWGGPGWGLFEQWAEGAVTPLIPRQPDPDLDRPWSMVIGDKDQRRFGRAIAQRFPTVRFLSLGSFGLKVLAVITGQAGIYIYLNGRVKLWDTTGPLALAQAAGLWCCDLLGQPIAFTEPAVDPHTLVHQQPIVVGWPSYIEQVRSPLKDIAEAIGLRR